MNLCRHLCTASPGGRGPSADACRTGRWWDECRCGRRRCEGLWPDPGPTSPSRWDDRSAASYASRHPGGGAASTRREGGEEKQGGKRFRVFPILINKETELIQATDVNNHLLTLCTRFSRDHNDQSFCCNICIPTLETCRHSDCFYICSLPPDFKATEGKWREQSGSGRFSWDIRFAELFPRHESRALMESFLSTNNGCPCTLCSQQAAVLAGAGSMWHNGPELVQNALIIHLLTSRSDWSRLCTSHGV